MREDGIGREEVYGDRRVAGVEALRGAGYTIDQLAAVAGFDTSRTLAELTGRRSLSDRTMEALRGTLSPHDAEAIAG